MASKCKIPPVPTISLAIPVPGLPFDLPKIPAIPTMPSPPTCPLDDPEDTGGTP